MFDEYVCEGDTIQREAEGFIFTATVVRDEDYHMDDDFYNVDQAATDEQHAQLLEARKALFNDEWFYCGIVISAEYNGVPVCDHVASLWEIEANYPNSDNARLTEVVDELLPEAINEAKKQLQELRNKLCEEN